jgi:hypothetical protein
MPDTPRLLHGMLPVLRCQDGSGMVSLGWPGDGREGDCIEDPSGLPDCEMTLKAFKSAAARDGYQEAMADLGGNAVSCSASRSHPPLPHLLLVFRHDRPRRDGPTLEEAIPLQDVPVDGARDYATLWRRHHERLDTLRREGEHAERWSAEIETIREADGVFLNTNVPQDTVSFISKSHAFVVSRGGRGVVVRWEAEGLCPPWKLPDDLKEQRDAAIAAAGATEERPGHLVMEFGRLDGEVISRMTGMAREIHDRILALRAADAARTEDRRRNRVAGRMSIA